jgi:NADH:ubiquinone oxidoreductase subunit 3 (subunit A)
MFPFAYMKGVLDIFYVIEIMIFILILILTLIFSIKSNFLKF